MKSSQNEEEVIKKIVAKDEGAMINFYNQYKKPVFNFILRKLNDSYLAEELTQDVFLDFIETAGDFRYQCSIKTFLFSIAKNKVVDTIRKKKIKKILFSALPKYFVESLTMVLMDDEIEKKELVRKIDKVFNKLPDDYRLILRLKYIDGEKVKNIARILSLKFKATESLLFRARKAFVKVFNNLP